MNASNFRMPLVLQICGDIEERIEALVSGLCWAEELGTSLEIYWWLLPPSIHCPFDSCFSSEALPSWVQIHGGMIESAQSIQSEAQFIEKGFPQVIKSKCRFYEKHPEKWLLYLRLLRPSFQIKQRMNLIPASNSIGIYIKNLKEPPVASVLTELWKRHRDASSFLLSTDCYESKRFLQLMYKDQLFDMIRTSKALHPTHYLEKVIDFFCFSQCSIILDCSQSHLMVLAAKYGKKRVIHL